MTCTPEEIERKRKLALEKLQAKKTKLSLTSQETRITNMKIQPVEQTTLNRLSSNFNSNNVKQETSSFNKRYNGICSIINKSSANSIPLQTNHSSSSIEQINVKQFFGDHITGSCYLISDNKFEVNIKYHTKVIEIFKKIPSARYNAENKLWNFNTADYNTLITMLASMQPHITIEKIPYYVLQLLNNCETNDMKINLERVEPELLNILMPFQKEGVIFGIKNKGRCLIADEMGLGKTLQALAIASYYKDDWPLLIVTTSSMKNTWEEAIHKYLPSVPLAYIRYMSTGKDYIHDAEILIVSYDLMARCTDTLVEKHFGVLIMDESHTIKNSKTKCAQSAITLSKPLKRIILLSGTPALSRPSELYTQLYLIDGKYFGNFKAFSKRYCDGQESRFGWDATGKSNLQELEIILRKKFMIRRTKNDVLNSLPEKSREVIKLDVGLNQLSEIDRLSLSTLTDNYVRSKKGKEKQCILLELFSESARIKIPSISLYLENLLKSNEKFIIFAHHQVMLDAISKLLNKAEKEFIRIDGSINSEQRKYFINKFQTKDSCIAAVLSITAASSGITLTAAKLVLFAELHWNPSILAQAESRAHRIGQTNNVRVLYLLAPGTVDDYIWPLLQSKQNVLNEIGLCKDSFENTTVSDQIVSSPSSLSRSSTKRITDFFETSQPENISNADEDLLEFLCNDDDDIFMNADIDF